MRQRNPEKTKAAPQPLRTNSQTSASKGSLKSLLQFLLAIVAVSMSLSLLMTAGSSATWNSGGNKYGGKAMMKWLTGRNGIWPKVSVWLWGPQQERVLTVAELSRFDGRDGRPAYLSVDGHVFDVTVAAGSGGHYGPGSSYNVFLGRDATRAFVTGCFIDSDEYATHDLRGFTRQQLDSVAGWLRFYQDHDVYRYVGRLSLPPIDKQSPVPPLHCPSADGDKINHQRDGATNGKDKRPLPPPIQT